MISLFKNIVFTLLILFTLISSVAMADGDGSILKIITPQDGQIVGSNIKIEYDLKKGIQGDHVHAYVDGKYQKGFKGTLYDLEAGIREIELKLANSDHDVLATSAKIKIEVK